MSLAQRKRVLYVGALRRPQVESALAQAGFAVFSVHSVDRAVALCTSTHIDVVILDDGMFVEVHGWSGAQSLHFVCPTTRVIVLLETQMLGDTLPLGVDSIIPPRPTKRIVQEVIRILEDSAQSAKASQ